MGSRIHLVVSSWQLVSVLMGFSLLVVFDPEEGGTLLALFKRYLVVPTAALKRQTDLNNSAISRQYQ